MPEINQYSLPPDKRPGNMVEWISLITSAIAETKGIEWFNKNGMTVAELVSALNGDKNFHTTINNKINTKYNTSDFTGAKILTELKKVDGINSGLDADVVRGYVPVNKGGDEMSGFLSLHADPTGSLHAVTKQYVDNLMQGFVMKGTVRVATTANITLSGLQTIDGVRLVVNDRVLVKDQTDAKQNGLYYAKTGVWTRTEDADVTADFKNGSAVFIREGNQFADSGWVLTTDGDITIGTTALNFIQFSGAGQISVGHGIAKEGNLLYLSKTGVVPGTYPKVTVDDRGRVTTATGLSASDIPNLNWSKITSGKPTTLEGYGITNATKTNEKVNGIRIIKKQLAAINIQRDIKAIGAIKLTVPNPRSHSMVYMSIKGYSYVTGSGGAFEILLGGFTNSDNTWIHPSFAVNGNLGDINARFGFDGTNPCILIGETTRNWDHSQITLDEVRIGYSNTDYNWESGWNLSLVDNFTGIIINHTKTINHDNITQWARQLQTARTIALSGDATGSVSFNGSSNVSIATTLSNSGVTAGTYTKVTVDAKGRVTTATNLSASDIPNLDWNKITSGKPTTLAGYGISDAAPKSHVGAGGTSHHPVVTNTLSGFMSTDMKIKLDTIAHAAEVNQNAFTGIVAGGVTALATNKTDNLTIKNGTNISVSANNTDRSITISVSGKVASASNADSATNVNWSGVQSKPTTLSGYGIIDGVNVSEIAIAATANKLLKLNSAAKLPASITGSADGNAATATKLQTTRTIIATGDATGAVSYDGSSNTNLALTLANSGVTAGTYTKVTVDAKGRVTSATNQSASDIPNLDWNKITTGKPTTLAGYGITDAVKTTGSDITGILAFGSGVKSANGAPVAGTPMTNGLRFTFDTDVFSLYGREDTTAETNGIIIDIADNVDDYFAIESRQPSTAVPSNLMKISRQNGARFDVPIHINGVQAETTAGAQTKANVAETNAKNASVPRAGGTMTGALNMNAALNANQGVNVRSKYTIDYNATLDSLDFVYNG